MSIKFRNFFRYLLLINKQINIYVTNLQKHQVCHMNVQKLLYKSQPNYKNEHKKAELRHHMTTALLFI